MLSIKALRPSQREKKRYIVYEVSGLEKENMYGIQTQVMQKINELLGIYDSASAGIQPIKYNQDNKRAIIKVSNKMTNKVKGCFVLITKIQNKEIQIRSVGTSGSLKKAKEKYLEIKE